LLTALTEGDTTALDDQIQCLAGGSVITHTADRSALRMHRLVARVIRDRHRADGGSYPALISTTGRMLGAAVFPEALAWQRRQDGDQLIAQIDTLWEHSDFTTQPAPPPLLDEIVDQLVSLRSWSVRQLTNSANLDRAITLANTVHTDCQRLLGGEHLRNTPHADRSERPRGRLRSRRGGWSRPSRPGDAAPSPTPAPHPDQGQQPKQHFWISVPEK
jgi:hypothetical protein